MFKQLFDMKDCSKIDRTALVGVVGAVEFNLSYRFSIELGDRKSGLRNRICCYN